MKDINCKNKVLLMGKVNSKLEFNHESGLRNYYRFEIAVERMSGVLDIIPVIISENQLAYFPNLGDKVYVIGCINTYISQQEKKLDIYVRANRIVSVDNHLLYIKNSHECILDAIKNDSNNFVVLSGYICKNGGLRFTPFGKKITDIMLAVDKRYKSSYIPCLIWGGDEKSSNSLKIGDKIEIVGRLQSREYNKVTEDKNVKKYTTYEVSVINYSRV